MAGGHSDINPINKNPPIDGNFTRKLNYQVNCAQAVIPYILFFLLVTSELHQKFLLHFF